MDISCKLAADQNHHRAYVGPPLEYDFMGATQFRLLCTLGLLANHSVLDVGCGSLRAGRLFIGYLDKERYFGIEPNKWLIEDAISREIGNDLVELKKPRFSHKSDFATDVFSQQFDFIIAQSIFSHAGTDLISTALRNFSGSLKPNGLVAVTFVEGISEPNSSGWRYPGCFKYRHSTIQRFAKEAGFSIVRLPWYHPRQTWYLLAKDRNRLPNTAMLRHLDGAVLFDTRFVQSWNRNQKILGSVKNFLKQALPQPIQDSLKRLLVRYRK
jgi:SAM-dependent methyltransferase